MIANAVIAAAEKAGTTSLFRSLSEHPQVAPASVKETRYFQPILYGQPLEPLPVYESYFRDAGDAPIRMEATPRYLRGFAVFRQQRVKTRCVTLGGVDAVDGIALGLGNGTFGLPTLAGHFLVEGLHGFVDLAGLFLLRLVHLVEGPLDLVRGRGDALHLHGFDA